MSVLKYRNPETGEFESMVKIVDIIDNLNSNDSNSALSANQGRILNEDKMNRLYFNVDESELDNVSTLLGDNYKNDTPYCLVIEPVTREDNKYLYGGSTFMVIGYDHHKLYGTQLATSYGYGSIKKRNLYEGVWGEWEEYIPEGKQIILDGDKINSTSAGYVIDGITIDQFFNLKIRRDKVHINALGDCQIVHINTNVEAGAGSEWINKTVYYQNPNDVCVIDSVLITLDGGEIRHRTAAYGTN